MSNICRHRHMCKACPTYVTECVWTYIYSMSTSCRHRHISNIYVGINICLKHVRHMSCFQVCRHISTPCWHVSGHVYASDRAITWCQTVSTYVDIFVHCVDICLHLCMSDICQHIFTPCWHVPRHVYASDMAIKWWWIVSTYVYIFLHCVDICPHSCMSHICATYVRFWSVSTYIYTVSTSFQMICEFIMNVLHVRHYRAYVSIMCRHMSNICTHMCTYVRHMR